MYFRMQKSTVILLKLKKRIDWCIKKYVFLFKRKPLKTLKIMILWENSRISMFIILNQTALSWFVFCTLRDKKVAQVYVINASNFDAQ